MYYRRIWRFQSLFYWIINSIRYDYCFEDKLDNLVSILILLDYQFYRGGEEPNLRNQFVSILILLDYQFYHSSLFLNIKSITKFQSLFYWIINSIFKLHISLLIINFMFQSLFYWIINSIRLKNLNLETSEELFQSLFYWIINSIINNVKCLG